MSIKVDATSFLKGTKRALGALEKAALQGVNDVASEILRIGSNGGNGSGPQVPHDTGMLQTSSSVQPDTDHSVIVGYNTVYAARLHEHPEYHFQKGRKGKYLEDPIKNNLSIFKRYIEDAVRAAFA